VAYYKAKLIDFKLAKRLFNEKELKNQVILTIENSEKKVVGFVNLISDYSIGEANFDLMRKTADAPNGTMDFLLARMLTI